MDAHKEDDSSLAQRITNAGHPLSRVQVSRIRRGESGASKATAVALEKLTGIPWHDFIGPNDVPVPPARGARATVKRAAAEPAR
jgi:hypothetical protein